MHGCCVRLHSPGFDVCGQGFDVVTISTGDKVAVQVHRDLDGSVPKLAAHVAGRNAPAQHQRGVGVAGVVDADVFHLRLLKQRPPQTITKPGIVQRLLWLRLSREDPR